MKSGIYQIINTVNQKRYIGYSMNISERVMQHKYKLKNRKHCNDHLQSAWNLYGEYAFVFEVIEYCDKSKLCEREDYWVKVLNTRNSEFGYNIKYTDPNGGQGQAEETKLKIGKSQMGRVFPKELIRKIAEKNKVKVIQFTLNGELVKEYDSIKEANAVTGISNICTCCKNIYKTAGGFVWKYKKDINE